MKLEMRIKKKTVTQIQVRFLLSDFDAFTF